MNGSLQPLRRTMMASIGITVAAALCLVVLLVSVIGAVDGPARPALVVVVLMSVAFFAILLVRMLPFLRLLAAHDRGSTSHLCMCGRCGRDFEATQLRGRVGLAGTQTPSERAQSLVWGGVVALLGGLGMGLFAVSMVMLDAGASLLLVSTLTAITLVVAGALMMMTGRSTSPNPGPHWCTCRWCRNPDPRVSSAAF